MTKTITLDEKEADERPWCDEQDCDALSQHTIGDRLLCYRHTKKLGRTARFALTFITMYRDDVPLTKERCACIAREFMSSLNWCTQNDLVMALGRIVVECRS